jgi:predicted nicotinamide N-methyase
MTREYRFCSWGSPVRARFWRMAGSALIEERVELGGHELRLLRPREAYYLIDEEAFDETEFLPYWAELWPSGVALARLVVDLDLHGRRVLELGAGLGLPSLAAALRGANVLATDWSEDAVELLQENARRNGLTVQSERFDWSEPEQLLRQEPWDLVLAADVLYEQRNVDALLGLLPRLGSEVLLADPGRSRLAGFLERFEAEPAAELVYRLAGTRPPHTRRSPE